MRACISDGCTGALVLPLLFEENCDNADLTAFLIHSGLSCMKPQGLQALISSGIENPVFRPFLSQKVILKMQFQLY